MRIIIANTNPAHKGLEYSVSAKYKTLVINSPAELTLETLSSFAPNYIFFPHWSHIIPQQIYTNYNCIVFHMTDLPYGRGGSPLQNLILLGHKTTKLSAIKVEGGIDTGPVYMKKELSLEGSAREIFNRVAIIIENMITEIIEKKMVPIPQTGTPTVFKRRTPEQSNISEITDIKRLYDYIRMLDAEGYPHAYLETEGFKIEFTNAEIKSENILTANVRITKK